MSYSSPAQRGEARDAIASKNVARQIADILFGNNLYVVFISDNMTLKWALRFLHFMAFLLHLDTWCIKQKIFS